MDMMDVQDGSIQPCEQLEPRLCNLDLVICMGPYLKLTLRPAV